MRLLENPSARFEYTISDTILAGVVLSGAEVKSLRNKHGSLKGSHIKIINHEAFLLNAQINPYSFASNDQYEPKRTRKLLLKKHEILKLETQDQTKHSVLVPLSIELLHNKIKITIGIGKGRKTHEKRAVLKERAIERDIAKELKNKVRLR